MEILQKGPGLSSVADEFDAQSMSHAHKLSIWTDNHTYAVQLQRNNPVPLLKSRKV